MGGPISPDDEHDELLEILSDEEMLAYAQVGCLHSIEVVSSTIIVTQVKPGQQSAVVLQGPFCGEHDAACAAVGALTLRTTGTAAAAPRPSWRRSSRRFAPPGTAGGILIGSSSNFARLSRLTASQTARSSTGSGRL